MPNPRHLASRRLFRVLVAGIIPAALLARSETIVAQVDASATSRAAMTFVRIPPGSFVMGSPPTEPGGRTDEQQHAVTLTRGFLLATTEVTQRQWTAVMGENPSYLYDCPDCPVEQVSWYDAIRFCNALSAREGFEPAYAVEDTTVQWNHRASGYRLPTEAEWEYACRAATTGAYATGSCLPTDAANYDGYRPQQECEVGLSRGQTIAVGSLQANAWGLYDMHGNVMEWCWDRHAAFTSDPVSDPIGPDRGAKRIVRGGCFLEPADRCRSASRGYYPPDGTSSCMGLRLARSEP